MTSIIPATALTCDGSDCRNTAARLETTVEMPVLDGVRVVQSSGLGKVLVATRDFCTLETVLLEPPALVFDHEDLFFSLFDGFMECSPETRAAVLEMHDTYSAAATSTATSATDMDMAAEMNRMRRDMMLESEFRRYSLEKPLRAKQIAVSGVKEKLMRIIDLNAHSFHEEPGDATSNVNGISSDDSSKGAIYVLGSKAEHSCAPNLRFNTSGTNGHGMLRYVATVPISRGDRVSISYVKSVLQTPRLERREFLMENKSFVCECVRCRGLDECNPLHCENCNDGLLFNAGGDDDRWCCTSKACGWNGNAVEGDGISRQIESMTNLANDISFLRDSLRYGIDERTLPQALKYQELIMEQCHPLHWLHIAAWDLGSIVASSRVQLLMMEEGGHSPRSSRVVSLLQLSAAFQIRQLLWTERNSAIVYGTLELTDAVAIMPHVYVRKGDSEDTAELCGLIDRVCDPKQRSLSPDSCSNTDVLRTVFHAGQDLLLAGHNDLAVKLYTVYEDGFRASPWTLSDANHKNFRDLIESGGRNNSFCNHLLAD